MATRSKQLTTASPMPPLKTAAKTEKAAWAPRLQRESQAIGERLSFQHWSKPFPWRGVRSAFVFELPRFVGTLHYAKTENGNGFTVTAGQGQIENGIIFWTNRGTRSFALLAKTENGNGFTQ